MAQSPKTEMLDSSAMLPGKVLLSIVTPEGRKFKHSIKTAETTIGRSPSCDVSLDDPMISGKHCTIESEDGGWRLKDLGSSNGTMLNGEFIEDEWLQDGDKITLGKTVLSVRIEEAGGEEEEEPAPPPRKSKPQAPRAPSEAQASTTGLVVAIVVAMLVLIGGGVAAFLIIGGGEGKVWQSYAAKAREVVANSPCSIIDPQVQSVLALGAIPSNQVKFRPSYFGKDKIILTPADKVANGRLAANDADRVRVYTEALNYLTAQRTQMDQRLQEMKTLAAKFEKEANKRKVDAVEAAMLLYTGQADAVMRSWRLAAGEAREYAMMFDEMFVRGNPKPLSSFQRFRMTKSAEAILRECQVGMERANATVAQALGEPK